jgi:protein TonB
MDAGGPETSGGGRPGRGTDVLVWVLAAIGLIGVAAAIAWGVSNVRFVLREVTYEDRSEDVELIPVAPPPAIGPPPAEPAARLPDEDGVSRPKWIRQPAPLFPVLALQRGVQQGEVRLRCEALASGDLGACEVLRETPEGAGFAEAALAATRDARIEPYSIDGFRTDSRIGFTVRFVMAPEN